MKNRVPLGDLIREANATASSYEREVTNAVFSSLEECVKYAMREELGPTWGVFCNENEEFRLTTSSDPNVPPGFVRWCPPLPEPPLLKWGNYCASCGGVVWAGQLACSDCGWTGAGWEGWEE